MKRSISALLCAIIIINFIFANFCYADEKAEDNSNVPIMFQKTEFTEEQADELLNEGSAKDIKSGNTQSFDINNGSFGLLPINTIFMLVCAFINIVPITAELGMSIVTSNGLSDITQTAKSGDNNIMFTIKKVVFNEVGFFNADYFDFSDSYTTNDGQVIAIPKSIIELKESVAVWFYRCRVIATAIGVLVLIYIGIRMAISTVASERAKYSKMLLAWVESMAILYLLQYLMIFLTMLSRTALNVCFSLKGVLEANGEINFEQELMNEIFLLLYKSSGVRLIVNTVILWCLAYTHLRFFLIYIRRSLTIGFLIIISPFITITYSIDKAGDGKAQAFSTWLNEFLINVLIQPIHAITYLVVSFTAGRIFTVAPILSLILLMAIPTVEKVVRSIFAVRGMSMKSLGEVGPGKRGH